MKHLLTALMLTAICAVAAASTPTPKRLPGPVKMLKSNVVPVLESVISVDGETFHAVEFQGEVFYFKLDEPARAVQLGFPLCHETEAKSVSEAPYKTLESRWTEVPQVVLDYIQDNCVSTSGFQDFKYGKTKIDPRHRKPSDAKIVYNPYEEILGFKSDF